MGCCTSKSSGDSSGDRVSRWRSTGIVALRDSKLKVLPDEVFMVDTSVRTLDLTNNRIVQITPDISKLVNMQRMILSNNLIEGLPTTIGVLRSLKVLILDGNQITSLPDELGFLSRLEKLSVIGNLLTSLPNNIGDLHNLSILNVSNNKLTYLPETIGGCTSLEELQANGNSLQDLPSSVSRLAYLKFLSLNNNVIRRLPQKLLTDCKALQNVSLHDNPITMDQFQQMEGFEEFEARRRKKYDKQIDSNVMMSSSALDEGLDLK